MERTGWRVNRNRNRGGASVSWSIAVAVLGVVATVAQPVAGAVTAATASAWAIVSPPTRGAVRPGALYAVVAVSAGSAWTAGDGYNSAGIEVPVVAHWNGRRWGAETPVGTGTGGFLGIAGSPGNVWAVGGRKSTAIAARFDGSRWRLVTTTGLPNRSHFSAVVVLGQSSVWAVGYAGTRMLAAHWNGTMWRATYPPGPAQPATFVGANQLLAVGRVPGTSRLVAVGQYTDSNDTGGAYIATWTGSAWQRQSTPSGASVSDLDAVLFTSAGDGWALGGEDSQQAGGSEPVALRWTGTGWQTATLPHPAGRISALGGLSATSSSDVWAVGYSTACSTSSCGPDKAMIEHFDGASWSLVNAPSPSGSALLSAINRIPGGSRFWAVGHRGSVLQGNDTPFVERSN